MTLPKFTPQVSHLIALLLLGIVSTVDAARPANDFFSKAAVLPVGGASPTTVQGSKAGATAEIGEPLHAGLEGVSVWYSWTAPADGVALFRTENSAATGSVFDSVLAIYRGNTVANLQLVADNDDDPASSGTTSRVIFPVVKDAVYRVAVMGREFDTNDFALTWSVAAGSGLLRFATPSFSIQEDSAQAQITLERLGSTTQSATVQFSTGIAGALDDATPGIDYTAVSTVVTFAPSQSMATVTILLQGDQDEEGDELVQLVLSDPTGALLGLETQAVLTLADNEDDPANDAFANAEELIGAGARIVGDMIGAGVEAGEPAHLGTSNGTSIWYRFLAPTSGALLLDTAESEQDLEELDTVLAVYGGTAVNALTLIAGDDNTSAETLTSRLILPVSAGVTYYIAIDSKVGAGDPILNWSFAAGGFVQFSQAEYRANEDGGKATIEVTRVGGTTNSATVTYGITAAGLATVDLDYVDAAGVITFAPGETTKTLIIGLADDTELEGDETVVVQLSAPTGDLALGAISETTVVIDDDEDNPENDTFAAARAIFGGEGNDEGSNLGARFEANEPLHGAPGGRSIWFKWRAPITGVVAFDTAESEDEEGEPLDTLLAVYTGTGLSSLKRIASNDNGPTVVTSGVTFAVTAGTTYYLAVDGHGGVQGTIYLNWTAGAGGLLRFSQAQYDVNELGNPSVTIQVTRTLGSQGMITVDYAVEEGSATDGEDFSSDSGTLIFEPGQTIASFSVDLFDDVATEGDESVLLTLSAPDGGAVLGEPVAATLTINDNEDDPANDLFANALNLDGRQSPIIGYNAGASRESGEPQHAGRASHRSIWYRWTAPKKGLATFHTHGSLSVAGGPLDSLLAVYSGTTLQDLKVVASNDDYEAQVASFVSFNAAAGQVYWIAVDAGGDLGGEVQLTWSIDAGGSVGMMERIATVREDDGTVTLYAKRLGDVSLPLTVRYQTSPGTATNSDFTAVSNGLLSFGAGEESANFTVAITDDSIVPVEHNESFTVTLFNPSGETTLLSGAESTRVTIDDDEDDPANDSFSNAVVISTAGGQGSISGTHLGSGIEIGESGSTEHTIWFSWTAPASGQAQFDTVGSGLPNAPLDTELSVFTGNAFTNLRLVTRNNDSALGVVTSKVTFAAVIGTTYRISVGARPPLAGPTVLNWNLITDGTFAFSKSRFRVSETGGDVEVIVNRTGPNVNIQDVHFATSSTAASVADNFTPTSGTLRFGPGQTSRSFLVDIKSDGISEGDQSFAVALTLPPASDPVATASVLILDAHDDPPFDHFAEVAAAAALKDESGSVGGTNVGSGKDDGENLPGILSALGSGRTLWFKWQAPEIGTVTFTTEGSVDADGDPLDTVLGVYTGTSLSRLSLVRDNDEAPGGSRVSEVSFQAKVGRIYFIAVDTIGDSMGDIALDWSTEPPEGDGPMLDPLPGFTPKVTFHETYSDALRSDGDGGREAVPSGSMSITMIASLASLDITSVQAGTHLEFSVGSFFHEGAVGDPLAKNTANSVTYDLYNSADEPKKAGAVKYSWTATTLTITASANSISDYFIAATDFYDEIVSSDTTATVMFGTVAGSRKVYIRGNAKVRSTPDFDLASISISGNADYAKPTILFGAPQPPAKTNLEVINLKGTVKDNFIVSEVLVRVNRSEPLDGVTLELKTDADGNEDPRQGTWALAGLALVAGTNDIEVIATDDSGNQSIARRQVILSGLGDLTLAVEGEGTLDANFTGTSLALAQTFSITARPKPGWIFSKWSGLNIDSPLPTLTFTMSDGLTLTATFLPNPFVAGSGNYGGIIRPDQAAPDQSGGFTLTLTPLGGFSVNLNVGGKKYKASGAFDENGDALLTLPARTKNGPPVTARLHFDLVNGTGQITGTFSDGTFTSNLVADRGVFDGDLAIAPQAGYYTVLLPPESGLFGQGAGTGYLTATLEASGSVRIAGSLIDNTAFTAGFASNLSASGVTSIYVPLKNGGVLVGSAVFNPVAPHAARGALQWFAPTRPTTTLGVVGERYDEDAPFLSSLSVGGATTSTVGGGGVFAANVTQTVIFDAKAKATLTPATPVTSIKLTPAHGIFKATIKQGNQAYPVKGAVLQGSGFGAGYFTNGAASGYFILGTP